MARLRARSFAGSRPACLATLSYHPLCRVLAAASPWRSRLKPSLPPTADGVEPEKRVQQERLSPMGRTVAANIWVDVAQGQAPRFSLAPVAKGG